MAIDFPVVNSDPSLPWLNPDTGITYIYKDGAWRVLSSTDFEDLEDIYVNVSGDTMTGELSLSAAGTVDITADALSVYHGGNYNAFIDWGGNAAFYDLIGEDAHFTRSVEVGTTGDVKITLNADGSASFAGDVQIGADAATSTTQGGINAYAGGAVDIFRASNTARSSMFTALSLMGNSNSKVKVFSIDVDGETRIGGDINAAPNIQLSADGSATFAGALTQGNPASVSTIIDDSGVYAKRSNNFSAVIFPHGTIGASGRNLEVYGGLQINTEPDNDDNYTVTTEEYTETKTYTGPLGNTLEREVTKTRDIRTYTGPTLDVKERLQNLIARMDAVEANEVIDDATDNSLLLAVAELTSRLNERDALITTLTTRIEALENA